MAHGIVRTDNMQGTHDGANLVSVRYAPSNVKTAIDNGNFVVVGNLETGEREVRVGTTPAANTPLKNLALIASEEVDNTKKYDTLADFQNKAGAICRGYRPETNHIFSLTADAFEIGDGVTPTVGTSVLEAQAKTKAKLTASLTSGSTKIADLIAIETQGTVTWYVFQVA